MLNPEIISTAMIILGVVIIAAIASKSSSIAEFSAGKDGIKLRFNGHKPEFPKIDKTNLD